ncbi:MAG: hypothetical protein KAR43_11890, partial [Deltaproteobacteria bacterium]|nr:hypothetical protein [Deltaproteobacteria bacterium]
RPIPRLLPVISTVGLPGKMSALAKDDSISKAPDTMYVVSLFIVTSSLSNENLLSGRQSIEKFCLYVNQKYKSWFRFFVRFVAGRRICYLFCNDNCSFGCLHSRGDIYM